MKKFCLIALWLIIFTKISYAMMTQTIDSSGDVGKYTSLCAHCAGIFHDYFSDSGFAASYYDETNGNLKFINDIGAFWNSLSPIVVDSTGDVGRFTSTTAWNDSSGLPIKESILIGYYDVTNGDLKCAWRKSYLSDTFKLSIIDSAGDVGQFTSIYVDTLNKTPYISYYDAINGDLKLAYFKDSAWSIQKIDTAGDVGKYNSIDGYADTITISYYDSTNGDLKLAKYNGTNWQIEKADTAGDVGKYSFISFSSWWTRIDYYDETNGDLKETWKNKDSLNWQFYKRDTTGDVGLFANFGRNGYFSDLCYYDKTNGDLKMLNWGIADTAGDVGGYPSGVSFFGGTAVVYYDFTNKHLKKAAYFEIGVEEEKLNPAKTGFNLEVIKNKISLSVPNDYYPNVLITIYDLTGRLKSTVYSGTLSKGDYTFTPNIKKSGIYFVQLTAVCHSDTERSEGEESNIIKITKKLVLLK
ncbi:MAG: T9SS type A sorting domain-containing protein [bacterium]